MEDIFPEKPLKKSKFWYVIIYCILHIIREQMLLFFKLPYCSQRETWDVDYAVGVNSWVVMFGLRSISFWERDVQTVVNQLFGESRAC